MFVQKIFFGGISVDSVSVLPASTMSDDLNVSQAFVTSSRSASEGH